MPIYEYRCQACGHELEATQRIVTAGRRAAELSLEAARAGRERVRDRLAAASLARGWPDSGPARGTVLPC